MTAQPGRIIACRSEWLEQRDVNAESNSEVRGAGGVATLTTRRERRRAFALLFLCLMCVGMGQSILFSNLPPLARGLGLTETETAAVFMASSVFFILASPVWGRRSDKAGRKPIVLIGVFGYAASMVCFASVLVAGLHGMLAGSALFLSLIGARSVYGILSSGTSPAAQAYVIDRISLAERTMAVATLNAASGLGQMIGPGIGAALAVIGLITPFYAAAVIAIVCGVAAARWLPERTPPADVYRAPILRPTDRRVIPHLLVSSILSLVQAVQLCTIGFYFMDTLGLQGHDTVEMVGVALTASALAAISTQLGIIPRFDLSIPILLRGGCAFALAGFVLLLAVPVFGTMVFSLILIGVGLAMIRPGNAAAISLAVSRAEQGAAAGLISASGAMGSIVGPAISLPLYGSNHASPFLLCMAMLAFALIYCRWHPGMSDVRRLLH